MCSASQYEYKRDFKQTRMKTATQIRAAVLCYNHSFLDLDYDVRETNLDIRDSVDGTAEHRLYAEQSREFRLEIPNVL